MPLNRFSVTRVAITGVMRSFITMKPLSSPIPIPTTNVIRKARQEGEPVQDQPGEHDRARGSSRCRPKGRYSRKSSAG